MITIRQEFYCKCWETWEKTLTREQAIDAIQSNPALLKIASENFDGHLRNASEEQLAELFELFDAEGIDMDDMGFMGWGDQAGELISNHTEDHEAMPEQAMVVEIS